MKKDNKSLSPRELRPGGLKSLLGALSSIYIIFIYNLYFYREGRINNFNKIKLS
jgi:hypothetical protein